MDSPGTFWTLPVDKDPSEHLWTLKTFVDPSG